MSTEWTDLTSGIVYGTWKIVKLDNGVEKACTTEDYSVVNLPANSMWRQIELYVGDSNVVDMSTSNYHYKAFMETLLSKVNISEYIIHEYLNICLNNFSRLF